MSFPHADFIRAIKIALQRWGIDSGEPRRHNDLHSTTIGTV